MDYLRTYSEKRHGFNVHVAAFQRLTAHPFPVRQIGYCPGKEAVIRTTFTSYNYSFILRGSGFYYHAGKRYEVQAPCVLTQSPDIPMHDGPDSEWEELYLIYGRSNGRTIRKHGLLADAPGFWLCSDSNVILNGIESIIRALDSLYEPYALDKLDRLCELLLIESLSRPIIEEQSTEEQIVRQAEKTIRENILLDVDIDKIARRHHMHPSTFRRHWSKVFPVPPGRLLSQLRLNEAARMLIETSAKISDIAHEVGYQDELYFSRAFRHAFQCTATEYRHRHRQALRAAKLFTGP